MSGIARSLIGCVDSAPRSYGMTMIVDSVHGSKNARIQRVGMDRNVCYGAESGTPVYQLRQVMNFLVMHGYLHLTDDEYPVLGMTDKGKRVLDGETVIMKVAKEQPKTSDKKEKKTGKSIAFQGDVDQDLFRKLKERRMEIAREEKVPPYIIFSDKTLVQMCLLKPGDRESMLAVSGVGEVKYEKYGEKFLEVLRG